MYLTIVMLYQYSCWKFKLSNFINSKHNTYVRIILHWQKNIVRMITNGKCDAMLWSMYSIFNLKIMIFIFPFNLYDGCLILMNCFVQITIHSKYGTILWSIYPILFKKIVTYSILTWISVVPYSSALHKVWMVLLYCWK